MNGRGIVSLLAASLAATVSACGSDDKGSTSGQAGSSGGTAGSLGGSSPGGAPSGGTGMGGAGVGGTSGASGASAAGGANNVCVGRGEVLPNGGCYIACQYNGGDPPRYDSTGVCTSFGWKCSVLAYCNAPIHCQVDATCQQYGGPAWLCVPTPTGPLVGECAIRCDSDADCPKNTATATPYTCKAIDSGTTTVKICRF